MKRKIVEDLLKEVNTQIKYTEKWNKELRETGKAKQINEMKLHCLDGKREALEEVLKRAKADK